MLDYESLRRDGLLQLERLTADSEEWTDFNEHDPGITILEQVCYALTDLSYRTQYEIPDLLASAPSDEKEGDPYQDLYPAPTILSSRAVTALDLRKLTLDTQNVRDAWITPFHGPAGETPLGGLHHVLIDVVDGADPGEVLKQVAARLHENRNVGEDFARIEVVTPELIQVTCTVEIDPIDELAKLRDEILARLAEHIAPAVEFATPETWWAEQRPVDEIFNGPLLDRRFSGPRLLDSEALQAAERPQAIYTAQLIRVIADIEHVRAVTEIEVASGGKTSKDWILELDPGTCARLDPIRSKIQFTHDGVKVQESPLLVTLRAQVQLRAGSPGAVNPFAPPSYRDRHVAAYHSVREQFPTAYGVGPEGLPVGAPPLRRAQAKQLAAYLMFFDQPLANYLAQLAHLRDLLRFEDNSETYFEQSVPPLETSTSAAATGAPTPPTLRRNRFLDHLLARFAEQLQIEGLMPEPDNKPEPGNKPARDKVAFLRAYPRISAARGTGFDAMREPGPDNLSGLEERVTRKLGLDASSGEVIALVEHILLRHYQGPIAPFVLPSESDPYSLQVTFVLPKDQGRFRNSEFLEFTLRTLREETPAHLVQYHQWVSDWQAFIDVRDAWLKARRDLGPFTPDVPQVLDDASGG